ncbi:MAG: NERD domain-containing protein [Lachnospiraceae bacterium]|nr:NERD domain-containing protein [Lachnospiraceae bacterium]
MMYPIIFDLFRDMWKNIFNENFIGRHGEQLIYETLKSIPQFRGKSKILRNVFIPKKNGEYTEIDFVVITNKGIFSIEAKNILGDIYGDERDKYWKAVVGDEEHSFYNPILQNEGHMTMLRDVLGGRKYYPILDIVVFSERAHIARLEMFSKLIIVAERPQLKGCVKRFLKTWDYSIDDDDIKDIYNKLEPFTHDAGRKKMLHIANMNRDRNK